MPHREQPPLPDDNKGNLSGATTLPVELLARLLDVIPCGILAKDPHNDLRYTIWNDYMVEMTGLMPEQVLGRTEFEIFPHEIAFGHDASDQEVLRTGRMVRHDGTVSQFSAPGHVINISKFPLRDNNGTVSLVLTLVEDVTQERRLERQVLQAQKMESLGRLAGGIAHDFNNLLQVIMGYGELLRGDMAPGAGHDDMGRILKAGRQAIDLVGQLLTISRQDQADRETIDLEALLDKMQQVLRRVIGDDITLTWKPTGNLPQVSVHAGQLEQVLLDLCLNARDAMPLGGAVTLTSFVAELDEGRSLRHPDLDPGTYVGFSVADTGCGVPAELQATIFEPFFTTKEVGKGTGLGLAAAYAVVRSHGGSIEVESRPGRGATFTVNLPAADAQPMNEDAPPQDLAMEAAVGAPGKGEVILVAEDQEDVRNLCRAVLSRAGYKVLIARDGAEAVEQFRNFDGKVDLLILDVVMPRLNGRAAYESIKELGADVPVIFCSGFNDDILARDYFVDTPGELLPKPYATDQLLKRVQGALSWPGRRRTQS